MKLQPILWRVIRSPIYKLPAFADNRIIFPPFALAAAKSIRGTYLRVPGYPPALLLPLTTVPVDTHPT
jgi:hypothetical protein